MTVPALGPECRDAVWGTGRAELAASLVRRRAASLRCPPLADGRRDPLDPPPQTEVVTSETGLDLRELLSEAQRLQRMGWSPWEIRDRLGLSWGSGDRP